ncbi:MAG: ABC transporter permease [Acidobacteriota bacterium]
MIRQMFRLTWNRKARSILLLLELLISFVVVFVVAALAVTAVANYSRPLGFQYDDVWEVRLSERPSGGANETAGQLLRLQQMIGELKQTPQIQHVGTTDVSVFGTSTWIQAVEKDGHRFEFEIDAANDDLASTLGIVMVAGRWFSAEDDGNAVPPIILSRDLAAEMYPGEAAVGQIYEAGDEEHPESYRVVGVTADFRKHGELSMPFHHVFYRKTFSGPGAEMPTALLLKMAPGTPIGFERTLTERLQAIAPDWRFDVQQLPVSRLSRLQTILVGYFAIGLVAAFLLLMVVMGLTGVFWQSVGQRRAEIGLRRAAGATACGVLGQIVGEVSALVTLAVAIGVLLIVQLPLFGLSQPWLSAGRFIAALVMSIVLVYLLAVITALAPAYLAAGVAPAEALRAE